jgi:hypothetical protein
MATKLTRIDHRKLGALRFRPQQEQGDGTIHHASNSRRFRCKCGKVHHWTKDNTARSRVACPCGVVHRRGDELTPPAE